MKGGDHMDDMNDTFATYCDQRLQSEDEAELARQGWNEYMRDYAQRNPEKVKNARLKHWARKRLRRDFEREKANENGPDRIVP